MKRRVKSANKGPGEEDPLCCCEYVDRRGRRSHVAACCCDCEDLDDVCDRWLKREAQKPDSISRLVTTVTDRLRIPWPWGGGGGARRVDLTAVPPLVLLPALLRLAALHPLLGAAVLTATPAAVLWYYYVTHRKKGRTRFFLSLALFSLAYLYYLFLTEVYYARGGVDDEGVTVGPPQLGVVTLGVLLTLAALAHTKRGPGYVWPKHGVHSTVTYHGPRTGGGEAGFDGGERREVVIAGRAEPPEEEEEEEGEEGAEQRGAGRRNWCSVCRVKRPPRAGHCRICGVCVLRLDHHCVWINSCVGQANHRSFLLTLLLFLLTSVYGVSLVLQSVCPQQKLLTALFYCPGVYNHYSSALCFTCAWYSSVVTGALLHLLVLQTVNVSCNVTEREARIAQRDKTARRSLVWGLAFDTGVYSRGFCANWAEFMTMGDNGLYPACTLPDLV